MCQMCHELVYRIEELERRVSNVIRVGRVKPGSQDHSGGTVQIMDGQDENDPDGWTSDVVPWKEHSGQHSTRSMPSDNQQVVLFSPGGQMEIGWASHGGYMQSDDMPSAPNGETISRRREVQSGASGTSGGSADQQKDITTSDYQGARSVSAYQSHTVTAGDYSHTMDKDGGHLLKAGDSITLKITKDGGFEFAGSKITHNGLPIDATHKHTDVQPGNGLTGIPSAA